ncbi:MAG TPA: pilin [Candidatus Dojkabacteria bacterium]|nr:pilin [Candidatus Dojkabacteria bacterium]HQF36822.1 pilin [Candidatus Dojkabacteria bacterium]
MSLINRINMLATSCPPWMNCSDTTDAASLDEVIRRFLNVASAVAALIAVVILIYGGIQYMISSGDSNKTEKAQNTIIYAIVGLVITAIAWLVIGFILNVLGGSGFKPIG